MTATRRRVSSRHSIPRHAATVSRGARPKPVRRATGAPDVFSLVLGVLVTGVAAGSLWIAFGGHLNQKFLGIGIPSLLVVIGVLGLTMSRNRE